MQLSKLQPERLPLGYSTFFWSMVGFASAGPDQDSYTVSKLALVATVLLALWIRYLSVDGRAQQIAAFSRNSCLWVFWFYCLTVVLSVRVLDYWSARVLFNLFVVGVAAMGAIMFPLRRWDVYVVGATIACVLLYRYRLYFGGDGKPLVHDQAFLLVGLFVWFSAISKTLLSRFGLLFLAFLVTLFSEVRSATFALCYLVAFWRFPNPALHFVLLTGLIFGISSHEDLLLKFGFLNSLSWRVLHWREMLELFDPTYIFFGMGAGFVWRESLELRNFYTQGENYVDIHSFYLQLLGDAGVFGWLSFLFLSVYASRWFTFQGKLLFLYMLSYGVFQGGVWQFSLVWVLLIAYGLRGVVHE